MILNPAYFYFICIILITRLFFQFRDDPITPKNTASKIIIESLALLALVWNYWMAVIFGAVIILNVSSFIAENKSQKLKLIRLIFLLSYLIIFAFLFSTNTNVRFNPKVLALLLNMESNFVLVAFLSKVDWNYFLLVFSGLLLVLNEANIFIRYLMETLHLVPHRKSKKSEIDTKEYNRGRVIGILERVLIYYFVLNSHLSAVGFILAAKGITRFKELENKEFAEYFLIGTLLSSIISGAIALLIRGILNILG